MGVRRSSYWTFDQQKAIDAAAQFRRELIDKGYREEAARVMTEGALLFLCSDAVRERKMIMYPEAFQTEMEGMHHERDTRTG